MSDPAADPEAAGAEPEPQDESVKKTPSTEPPTGSEEPQTDTQADEGLDDYDPGDDGENEEDEDEDEYEGEDDEDLMEEPPLPVAGSEISLLVDEAGCGKGDDSEDELCRKNEVKRLRTLRIKNKALEKEKSLVEEESKVKLLQPVCDIETECRIRPRFSEKFRPGDVQRVIEDVMRSVLTDKEFDDTLAQGWITEMVTRITDRVVAFGFPRYKTVVDVTLVELRGQSASVGSRCFWDAATDSSASFTFTSETMVACGAVFGLYHY